MQEIIDVYGEEYLKNILSNYDKLSKVYEEATKSKIGMDGSDPEYQNIQKAIDLYNKFNFEIVNIRKSYYQDNHEDAYLMTRAMEGIL